jgi:hypothetical protein
VITSVASEQRQRTLIATRVTMRGEGPLPTPDLHSTRTPVTHGSAVGMVRFHTALLRRHAHELDRVGGQSLGSIRRR